MSDEDLEIDTESNYWKLVEPENERFAEEVAKGIKEAMENNWRDAKPHLDGVQEKDVLDVLVYKLIESIEEATEEEQQDPVYTLSQVVAQLGVAVHKIHDRLDDLERK